MPCNVTLKEIHSNPESGMLLRDFVFSFWEVIYCYPNFTDGF